METLINHALEPEIAGPPPRRVHLPARLNFLLAVAGLLLGLFLSGSGRVLWEAGKLIASGMAGHSLPHGSAGRVVSLTFTGGLVLLVSLLLLRRLWLWASDRLRLLCVGVATVGTILHKRTEAEDVLRYYLRYGYAASPGMKGREIEEQVSLEQWKRFEVGQPVTVLFHPDAPGKAGLYALLHEK